MTIDIRNLPVLYINLDNEKERDIEMYQMLTDLGFTNFSRFGARKAQCGADGCFLSHINAAYRLYATETDYVIVMEDDSVITDMDRLNSHINDAIDEYDFDVLSAYFKIPGTDGPYFGSIIKSPPYKKHLRPSFFYISDRPYHPLLMI